MTYLREKNSVKAARNRNNFLPYSSCMAGVDESKLYNAINFYRNQINTDPSVLDQASTSGMLEVKFNKILILRDQ